MGQSSNCVHTADPGGASAAGAVEQGVGQVQTELVQLLDLLHQFAGSVVRHVKHLAAAIALHMHVTVTALTTHNLIDRLPVRVTGKPVNGTGFRQSRQETVERALTRLHQEGRIPVHPRHHLIDGKSLILMLLQELEQFFFLICIICRHKKGLSVQVINVRNLEKLRNEAFNLRRILNLIMIHEEGEEVKGNRESFSDWMKYNITNVI